MSIHLDGTDISILKAIGFGGTRVGGEALLDRISEFGEAELIDAVKGLIAMGYVESDRQALYSIDDFKRAAFNVNSGYSKELRDEVDPRRKKQEKPSRRVRRE